MYCPFSDKSPQPNQREREPSLTALLDRLLHQNRRLATKSSAVARWAAHVRTSMQLGRGPSWAGALLYEVKQEEKS